MNYSKNKIFTFSYYNKPIVWTIFIVVGLLTKILLLPVKTGDFVGYLEPWMSFIKSHGYYNSLKFDFYNYTPSYIYILIGIVKSGVKELYLIKIVSIIFEYIAAFYIGKIAFLKYKNNNIFWASFALIPIIPSVLLNSSYLSQCDSIYVAFIVASIFYFFKNNTFTSIVLLGVAFALKAQTAFILPFFFVMLLNGRIKAYYFFAIPIVYIVSILPAAFYGRNIYDLLTIYINQSSHYKELTLNLPNIYILISNDYYETAKTIGITFTVLTTLIAGFWLRRNNNFNNFEFCVKFAFLCAIIIPYILPGMHERYLYLADLLGVLYFFVIRKNIFLPLGIWAISFYSYIRCSRFNDILPMEPAFIIYSLVIIFAIIDLSKTTTHES